MITPAQQHWQNVMAQRAGRANEGVDHAARTAHEEVLYRLRLAQARLKGVQARSAKAAIKKELLPDFSGWIEGTLEADGGQQDEVIATLMVWAIDCGDLPLALRIGAYVVRHNLIMPDNFGRTAATVLTEEICNPVLTQAGTDADADLSAFIEPLDNSTSETQAATPKAVKAAYDLAAGKAPVSHTHPWSQITDVPAASLTVKGTVQLSSATNSTSETQAATPKAVKAVYDLANGKQPADATLTALAGLATATDKLPYFTGNDTASLTTLTNVGRDILAKTSTQEVIQYIGCPASPTGWLKTGNNGESITTAQLVTLLQNNGAFNTKAWFARCAWSYATSASIPDSETGCGIIPLAGAVIEVFSNNTDNYTIRITTATTTSVSGALTNAEFIYVFNVSGSTSYSPGWRRAYNTKNKPTTTDLGLSDESGYVGRLISTRVFTSSGTYIPTPGTKRLRVTITGGGGGGGGCKATSNNETFFGAGGGAGGTIISIMTPTQNSYPVTIGAGGAGGVSATNGTRGGNSVFASLIAPGGAGGGKVGVTNTNGGNGGVPSTGDIRITGGDGGDGQSGNISVSGEGGTSHWGGGGRAGAGGGVSGKAYGSGGGGAYDAGYSGTSMTGGKGAAGICIIEEFA